MRKSLAIAVLLGAWPAAAQEPAGPIPTRYGVLPAPEAYPQRTPREALLSAARAIERGKVDYLVAHVIDPKFVDARVAARARLIEEDVEKQLRAERDAQRLNPPRTGAIPVDPAAFAAAVQQVARERAFREVVRDIRDTLAENPDHIRDFRRFARDGLFADAGDTSSASLRGVTDRQVFFRKEGTRWFVEDRQKAEQTADKK
jgi:hypothetical protein